MITEDEYANRILDLNRTMEERIQAAFHLENATKDENILKLVKGLETDPSPIVRHEFAFSLGETAHPKIAGPALQKAAKSDPNVFVRHESILALATLGKDEFLPFIQQFLDDPVLEIAESAAIAIQRIKQTGHQ